MTKAEIKEKLKLWRWYCEGAIKQAEHRTEEPADYFQGQIAAYKDMLNRICTLEDEII